MKKQDIILIGGGGHCKSCIDVIEYEGKYNIAGIVDVKEKIGQTVLGYDIIASDEDLGRLSNEYTNFFISIGQIKNSKLREDIVSIVSGKKVCFPSIISPKAYVSKNSSIGQGNIIMHNSILNAGVKIGDFNILNTGSIIEHDSYVGNFNHVSISSVICGTVLIGDYCFIGANSTIRNNIKIANGTFIGANSYVNKNIAEKGLYVGNPIRKI